MSDISMIIHYSRTCLRWSGH